MAGDVYVIGLLIGIVVLLLSALGYVVIAKEPDVEEVLSVVTTGIMCIVIWPVSLVCGVLVGSVLGMRRLVHGSRREAS